MSMNLVCEGCGVPQSRSSYGHPCESCGSCWAVSAESFEEIKRNARALEGLEEIAVSEKQFMESVIELATWTGWRSYHAHDSRRSAPGFPDVVLARNGRLLFVELKSEKGKLNPAQRAWIGELRRCSGVEVHVWRPSSWPEIEEALTERSPTKGDTGNDHRLRAPTLRFLPIRGEADPGQFPHRSR